MVSIVLVLILAFAGFSTVLHQLEQGENHRHEDGTHLCAPDHHHHCTLCDVIIHPSLVSSETIKKSTPIWINIYTTAFQDAVLTQTLYSTLGRAPPTV